MQPKAINLTIFMIFYDNWAIFQVSIWEYWVYFLTMQKFKFNLELRYFLYFPYLHNRMECFDGADSVKIVSFTSSSIVH